MADKEFKMWKLGKKLRDELDKIGLRYITYLASSTREECE
jgi:hypothetical protein